MIEERGGVGKKEEETPKAAKERIVIS